MKVVAIIQARMSSMRLPGKVLMDLAGEPMLKRVVNRTRRAQKLDEFIVATTTDHTDDPIAQLCNTEGWPSFRGSLDDVLDRYHAAAREVDTDVVVRITSDCPMIDPGLIDVAIGEFLRRQPLDYLSNTIPPRTFPRGLDVEVFSVGALGRAWREDKRAEWREHVTPYIYRNPESFRIDKIQNECDVSDYRWTVDTPQDLQLARTVYGHLGHDLFAWRDLLKVFCQNPHWIELNRGILQKPDPQRFTS